MDDISVPLLAICGAVFLVMVFGYVQLMVDRSRGVGMRLFFGAGLAMILSFMLLINFRADAAIQARSHSNLCEARLQRLASVIQQSRMLRRGIYPETWDDLVEVPDFRHEDLRCPVTGSLYRLDHALPSRGGSQVCFVHDDTPHVSESRLLPIPASRHLLRVSPGRQEVQEVPETKFAGTLLGLREGPSFSGR